MKRRENRFYKVVVPALVMFTGLFLVSSVALAEDPQELPDMKALLKELDGQYKDSKNRDTDRIVAIYAIFDENYDKVSKQDQAKILKAMKKAYTLKIPYEKREFLQSNAAALSSMGKKGVDILFYALKSKVVKPKERSNDAEMTACLNLETFIIESIGYSKDPSALKPLLKLLWHDRGEIVRATCNALAQYSDFSVKHKKPIVEEMVKVFTMIDNEVLKNPKRPELREKLVLTEGAFVAALQKLTPGRVDKSGEWQSWYNDNKGKSKW